MPTRRIHKLQRLIDFHRSFYKSLGENPAVNCRIFNNSTLLIAFLCLTLFIGNPCAAEPIPSVTVIHYHLDVELHPAEQNLSAAASILLPTTSPPIVLKLASHADISLVEIDEEPVLFTFQGGTLTIPALSAHKEKPARLTIRYRARFAEPLPVETIGVEDPSFGVGATILPEGTYLSAGTAWFPQVEGQRGLHRLQVSAPAGIIAVTAGRMVETFTRDSRTVTVWENNFPLEGLALVAGRFELARDQLDGIQLLTFLSPDNAALAPVYLAAMRRHLTFYRELLGPYPFAKFAVVENFLPTGYGMPSWTLLGKSVVRLPFMLDTSLPHEIVHSWWGNAIEVDYAQGNWAEGLTTYLADYLLKERGNHREALEYRRKILRDYAALVSAQNDFPLASFSGRRAKYQQAIGYGKGAMVFHMLRRKIGDPVFWTALRRLAAEGSGRAVGWTDIERIFSDTAETDLHWFFAQWVEQKGAPKLILDEVRSVRSAKGWTINGVVRQTGQVFRLDLPLKLTGTNGETLEQSVVLAGRRTPFSFDSSGSPSVLEADPDSSLFRQLAPEEVPATVNDLLAPQRPLVVLAGGQAALRQASRDLLKGLHWDYADIIDESRIDPKGLIGRDLLFLGWPLRPELRPKLPASLKVNAVDRPSWELPDNRRDGDALFAVIAGRHQQGTSSAVLLTHSPEAARMIAAKVAHYGRYSLLLFEGGRNLVKATWEPQASPLKVILSREIQP